MKLESAGASIPQPFRLDKPSTVRYTESAMKSGIHPSYSHQAKVTCSCGKSFITGSTVEELPVEVCSNCHPFFTGKQNLVDTAGRVDRFKKLVERSGTTPVRSKRTKLEAKKAKKVAKATRDEV